MNRSVTRQDGSNASLYKTTNAKFHGGNADNRLGEKALQHKNRKKLKQL